MSIERFNEIKGLVDDKTNVYVINGNSIIDGRISHVRLIVDVRLDRPSPYEVADTDTSTEATGDISEESSIIVRIDNDTINTYGPDDIYLSYDDAKAELARCISAKIESLVDSGRRLGATLTLKNETLSTIGIAVDSRVADSRVTDTK